MPLKFNPRDMPGATDTPKPAAGIRHAAGKVRLDLIPPEWVWGVGQVFTRVIESGKYPDRNWEKGMKWSYCFGAMLRHGFKFICGQKYDPETGCHHMAMVAWNALALMSYDIRGIGENDLPGKFEWLEMVVTEPTNPWVPFNDEEE